jgi:hypothetical protein
VAALSYGCISIMTHGICLIHQVLTVIPAHCHFVFPMFYETHGIFKQGTRRAYWSVPVAETEIGP